MEETPKMISITPIIKHIKIDQSPNALILVFQIIDSRSRSLNIQQRIIITIETAELKHWCWIIVPSLKVRLLQTYSAG